ncbi:MAG: hypothetical protein KJ025_03465 [Burkholderiales bacterium]|nr:hypothetical protein [Burkholderiales bacterium]
MQHKEEEDIMTAFNVVRFRVRPGYETQFVETYRKVRQVYKGSLGGAVIKTGDRTFCYVGEWRNMQSLAAARPAMITTLDRLRGMLEDLGGGLGVTDPVSGEVVARFAPPKAAKKRPARGGRKAKPAKAKKRAAAKRKR